MDDNLRFQYEKYFMKKQKRSVKKSEKIQETRSANNIS